jgi:hypothetical protein
MRTVVILEIDHRKDIPSLGEMIAGRAYTISGVTNVEFVKDMAALPVVSPERLRSMGFTLEEISLGSQDVERS